MTPDPATLAKAIADTQNALNIVWTLVAGFLVMFMQAGFALVETGLTRAKNVAHTMGMNFLVYSLGMLSFWAVGFGLQMGGVGALTTLGGDTVLSHEYTVAIAGNSYGLFGMEGFFLSSALLTPGIATLFLFQMVFMDTAATIPTGAMAERWKFASFCFFSLLVGGLIYPVYANWVWGGGWLSGLGRTHGLGHGHVDFAGSSVVHLTGGVSALVGARMLGPRIGKFAPDGAPRAIPGHNVPMAVLGTFVLAFGWFGFNAGSTLSGTDTRIAIVAVNTMLASAAGAVSACVYVWKSWGRPDVTMMCNGMLAGLVAVTAPCAFISPTAAVVVGSVSGVLVVVATRFVEEKLRIDDPVGAIAVHGFNGLWGIVALGLFANGTYGDGINGISGGVRGLFYGDSGQLAAGLVGILANTVWVGLTTACSLWVLDRLVGNRSDPEDEIAGLDVPEIGIEGYSREMLGLSPGQGPSLEAQVMTDTTQARLLR
ncbi:MAG TPA: ammonium transporter [Polyangiaceae bacterium]|nr:ammonium transporter [Polyangiaceae bacterium]